MATYGFGAGSLWATPTQDAYGNTISNPTPVMFGVLQEVTIDYSGDLKELFGQLQLPVAIGRGKTKLTGKAKNAQMNGALMNSVVFGQTLQSGSLQSINYDTTGATIPTPPFTITPTVPNSGTWLADKGVIDSNGLPMTRVASTPATGQYSVAAGVYTFAAADTGQKVFINYSYTATIAGAKKLVVNNLPMGFAPAFAIDLYMSFQGKPIAINMPNCVSNKLGFATKLDDFLIPEFDWSCFADTSGVGMTWSFIE